ncbi:class I SAM-dependent methyltransferase [Novosphingobium sp. 9]|uniref:class I SAM-dependent methyltransferase n=1 Tax=Novosphingobium sp. 9 TaxID=2025349 RepID=UPI0021B6052B|nr:methyltransferase domain-containing protein [Novosphingobium sp. 9]
MDASPLWRQAATIALGLSAGAVLAGCQQQNEEKRRPADVRDFPVADRPVSSVSDDFSSEVKRDSFHEATTVMDLARIEPGMTVADIGAGAGYYTVRLSPRVGRKGRVLAEDIEPDVIRDLGLRIERERLENVSIRLGAPEDPKLPDNSFDRIFLVHMYHEVTEPYAFAWHLRPALRPGGRVIVVETDRATDRHGIPPALLFCEMGSVGFRLTEFVRKPELQGYYAQFEVAGPRPEPSQIKPCRLSGTAQAVTS